MVAEPRIELTLEQAISLYSLVPSWHVDLLGPIPDDGVHRLYVVIEMAMGHTSEDAVASAYEHAQTFCAYTHREYDPSEWEVARVLMHNGN